MARHHRQGVQTGPATTGAPAAAEGPAGAAAAPAPPLSVGWQIALTVWALGIGGLVLYELVGFVIRAVRGPG